jgi:hypothetical protein
MPEKGGLSDKYGNRYESYWTVACVLKVLDEKADFIHLEPSGKENDGIEFYLSKDDKKDYYQVKRQNTIGKWTLSDLESKNILSTFWNKLKDENNRCHFISTYATYELDELANRAQRIESFEEFSQSISDTKKLKKGFYQQLCDYWSCSPVDAYKTLQRVEAKALDENSLKENVDFGLYTLVEGNSATVRDILAQFTLDKAGKKLKAYDIWNHLEERGYKRRDFSNDEHVLKIIEDNNQRYIDSLNKKLITNRLIPRIEANYALDYILDEDSSNLMILGSSGKGKSNVILQIVNGLRKEKVPFIVLRLDRLEPCISPEDLGLQLKFPDSPAKVLGAISKNSKGVLIIDQLDALSLISGRHPEFFECIYELIRQSKIYSNIKLIIGCRQFDLDNDYRFQNLKDDISAKIIELESLSKSEVEKVIDQLNLDNSTFDEIHFKLLSLPLHLKLLEEIVKDPNFNISNFKKSPDLYSKFWEYKEKCVNHKSKFRIKWTGVMDKLCNYMSNKQVLSVPKVILDEFAWDARYMTSERVLSLENDHYSFFHENYFDYAFARRFASQDLNIVSFLKKNEQDLFRSAQVRQILSYERENNYFNYIINLKSLLYDPNIRFHIKEVTLAFLSGNKDIKEEECRIIISLTEDPSNKLFMKIGKILHGSSFWFEKINSQNLFEKWLASEDERYVNYASWLLYGFKDDYSDRVAELIEPYIGLSENWNNRIISLMRFADFSKDNKLYALFLRSIDDGTFDDKVNGDYKTSLWHSLQYSLKKLSKKHPERATCIFYHYLKRRLDLSLPEYSDPFEWKYGSIPDHQFERDIILGVAKNDPEHFVEFILPLMLKLMEINKLEDDKPFLDKIWEHRHYGKSMRSNEILLESMETALMLLIKINPSKFESYENLLKKSNFETAQFLLMRAYSANGKDFVNNAVEYISKTPSLEIGYLDNRYWVTRELIKSIRPYCSDEQIKNIEDRLLDYYKIDLKYFKNLDKWISTFYPLDSEKIRYSHYRKCKIQFGLLEATPSYNRSDIVIKRINDLKKELNIESPEPPMIFESFTVTSPISNDEANNMTDDQWLKALQKYENDIEDLNLEGGAYELSHTLESIVKMEPERFSRLIYRFPENTNPYYFKAVLNGIKDSTLDTKEILDICEYCHNLPGKPCGKEICDVIGTLANEKLPNSALRLITWYALNDPDPEEELWSGNNSKGIVYYNGNVFDAGINSVRGFAAFSVHRLIYYDAKRISFFKPTLEKMVNDPSYAVKSCVAMIFEAIFLHDKGLAKNLFNKLYNMYSDDDDVLLSSRSIERFLYLNVRDNYKMILPILEKMVLSNMPEVAKKGAELISIASLISESSLPQFDYCFNSEIQRKGVANVFATNISYNPTLSKEVLSSLFNDPSPQVQTEAARCFFKLKENDLSNYLDLIDLFIESKAFIIHHEWLFLAFEKNIILPDIVVKACEKFFEITKEDAGDISTAAAGSVKTISTLILNIYNQCNNDDLKKRCLNLIDFMLKIDAYGFGDVLLEYEKNIDLN